MGIRIGKYRAIVEEWRKQYGVPLQHSEFNLTLVSLPVCFKCGKQRLYMHRHHVSNDFLFACLRPSDYAKRYIHFHPDDVRWLCKHCHKNVHRAYHPVIKRFWMEAGDAPSREVCDKYRELCKKTFYRWVKRVKNKRRPSSNRSHS